MKTKWYNADSIKIERLRMTLTVKNIDTRNIAKWISCYYKQEKMFSSNTLFMTMLESQSTLDFYIHYPLDKKVYHCCWNCQFWCSESSIHFRHELFHRCRSIARIINYIEKWSNYIGAYDKSISLHKIVLDIHRIEIISEKIFSHTI